MDDDDALRLANTLLLQGSSEASEESSSASPAPRTPKAMPLYAHLIRAKELRARLEAELRRRQANQGEPVDMVIVGEHLLEPSTPTDDDIVVLTESNTVENAETPEADVESTGAIHLREEDDSSDDDSDIAVIDLTDDLSDSDTSTSKRNAGALTSNAYGSDDPEYRPSSRPTKRERTLRTTRTIGQFSQHDLNIINAAMFQAVISVDTASDETIHQRAASLIASGEFGIPSRPLDAETIEMLYQRSEH